MHKRIPFLLGLILVAFAVWMQVTSVEFVKLFIVRLDNLAYDMQLRTQIYTHNNFANGSVAIVDIDDKSLTREGRWPWPRSKLADLLNRLQEEGVVVIALDMMFPEKELNIATSVASALQSKQLMTPALSHTIDLIQSDFDEDKKFEQGLANKDVVLGMSFLLKFATDGALPQPTLHLTTADEKNLSLIHAAGYLSNVAEIQVAAKNAGFINVYADPDGIIRRVPLLIRYQDDLYPSLALAAVNLYLLTQPKLNTAIYAKNLQLESVQIGDHAVPVDAEGSMLIPFEGRSFTFPYFSATDVLHKNIKPNALAGKIVFLGTSATGLGDLRATAIQGVFPGVEIQATIADSILKDHYSYKPAWTLGTEIFITIFLGIIMVFVFPYLGPAILTLCALFIPMGLIFLNNILWEKTGLVIFIFIPIALIVILAILNMVYGYLFETRKRVRLKEMFGQYVPEKHIDEMLKASTSYGLLGEDREMTVLFADIRNFTTISEPMTATELKTMLNEFFTPMTEIIFNHSGTIDKYIGDLIMAFWGAPLKDKKHAQHALEAAINMQLMVDKLKPQFDAKGWPDINIGIGVNSGVMSVGDMGSQFRRNYTVLGDAVNLGSRVESLTKFYGVKIMTTENTCRLQKKFVCRLLDRVRVKGKRNGVALYEVIGRETEITLEKKEEFKQSEAAIALYAKQEWDAAENAFKTLAAAQPQTILYPLYLERIAQFRTVPPGANWDGTFDHTHK